MQRMSEEHFVVDITNEDLEVTEKWLIKVSIIEEEEKDEAGNEEFVSKKMILELIEKFAPTETLVLGFEISKLPGLWLSDHDKENLLKYGKLEFNLEKILSNLNEGNYIFEEESEEGNEQSVSDDSTNDIHCGDGVLE